MLLDRVLARILDLGRVSNDLGVHVSITSSSQIHGSSYARQQQTMPVVVLCFATEYKLFQQLLGVFKTILTPYSSHYPSKH
jgi:hypothetical protein